MTFPPLEAVVQLQHDTRLHDREQLQADALIGKKLQFSAETELGTVVRQAGKAWSSALRLRGAGPTGATAATAFICLLPSNLKAFFKTFQEVKEHLSLLPSKSKLRALVFWCKTHKTSSVWELSLPGAGDTLGQQRIHQALLGLPPNRAVPHSGCATKSPGPASCSFALPELCLGFLFCWDVGSCAGGTSVLCSAVFYWGEKKYRFTSLAPANPWDWPPMTCPEAAIPTWPEVDLSLVSICVGLHGQRSQGVL